MKKKVSLILTPPCSTWDCPPSPNRKKGPSPHPWSLGWPWDLVWPTSCGWSVGVPVLRQGLQGLAGVTSSWLTGTNLGQPVGGDRPSGGQASCPGKGQPRPAYSQLTPNSWPAGLWAVISACDFKPQNLEWFVKHKAARENTGHLVKFESQINCRNVLLLWNSSLTRCPVFLLAQSGNPKQHVTDWIMSLLKFVCESPNPLY